MKRLRQGPSAVKPSAAAKPSAVKPSATKPSAAKPSATKPQPALADPPAEIPTAQELLEFEAKVRNLIERTIPARGKRKGTQHRS